MEKLNFLIIFRHIYLKSKSGWPINFTKNNLGSKKNIQFKDLSKYLSYSESNKKIKKNIFATKSY